MSNGYFIGNRGGKSGESGEKFDGTIPWKNVTGRPISFPPDEHNHDGQYSSVDHNHDGVYQPAGNYATSSHTHTFSEITGVPNIPPDLSSEVTALRNELDILKDIVEGLQSSDESS